MVLTSVNLRGEQDVGADTALAGRSGKLLSIEPGKVSETRGGRRDPLTCCRRKAQRRRHQS